MKKLVPWFVAMIVGWFVYWGVKVYATSATFMAFNTQVSVALIPGILVTVLLIKGLSFK